MRDIAIPARGGVTYKVPLLSVCGCRDLLLTGEGREIGTEER